MFLPFTIEIASVDVNEPNQDAATCLKMYACLVQITPNIVGKGLLFHSERVKI
jgi:hypothetical protein